MLAARSAISVASVELSAGEGKLPSAMTQDIEIVRVVSTASRMSRSRSSKLPHRGEHVQQSITIASNRQRQGRQRRCRLGSRARARSKQFAMPPPSLHGSSGGGMASARR